MGNVLRVSRKGNNSSAHTSTYMQVSFTCVEMRDCEQPYEAACGPEALLKLVIETASEHGVAVTGENALQRYAHLTV